MRTYILEFDEISTNVQKIFSEKYIYSLEFTPFDKSCDNNYIKFQLKNNNIIIRLHDNKVINGSLDFNSSVFNDENLKLVYKLEDNINFLGGTLILEKNKGTIVYNGSGVIFISSFIFCSFII